MTPESEVRRTRFFELIERFIRLGELLPAYDEIDRDKIDELRLVLREMAVVKDRIDAMIGAEQRH